MLPNELHAIIGVVRDGSKTLYVKRSDKLADYPGVWSLLSSRTSEDEARNFLDLEKVQLFVNYLAETRLDNTKLRVKNFLTSAHCWRGGRHIFLYMYELELLDGLKLNPDIYTDARFMEPDEYQKVSAGTMCGMCMSMWSRFCVKHGLVEENFAEAKDIEPEGGLYD